MANNGKGSTPHFYGNPRYLYKHNFGYVLNNFVGSDCNVGAQEPHALFRPEGSKRILTMNSKELRGSGEWLDLHGFGFAIIENIKPELSIEARHEIWQLEDMTSFGVCRVIDPWSNLPIHLLPRHPEGTDREFRIETGIGCDRTIALQQTVLEEEGTGVYRDVDTKLAVKLETISRTSEAWSNLELAHCQLLSRIRGLPPSDRNKI